MRGGVASRREVRTGAYWEKHMCGAVRFTDALRTLAGKGIRLPYRPTRGWMTLQLRSHETDATDGNQVVNFCRYRGRLCSEVQNNYREEARGQTTNLDNGGNGLRDLARAQRGAEKSAALQMPTGASAADQQRTSTGASRATSPPPTPSRTTSRPPDPPAAATPPRAATAGSPVGPGKRAAESDPRMIEEIRALEQRLAVLRDRERLPTHTLPEVPQMPARPHTAQTSEGSWVREEAQRREDATEVVR